MCYRIKKQEYADGNETYTVQWKFCFIWWKIGPEDWYGDCRSFNFASDAERYIDAQIDNDNYRKLERAANKLKNKRVDVSYRKYP
jgi:hypothetical protein